MFYANNGDGTFSDISGVIGLDFLEDGRSFALADFDHDGRQEVFLKNRNGPVLRILKNVIEKLPPSISFRLRGTKSNRDAIGAVITVTSNAGKQARALQAGSGFLSRHSKDVFFGLGTAKGTVQATIQWPSGKVQELSDLPMNHRVWVDEGSTPTRIEPFRATTPIIAPAALDAKPQEIEALPTTAETWLLAPFAAPDFSLPDLSRQLHSLSALRGKPVLLNFWAAGAAGWAEDRDAFNQRYTSWSARGLRLLTVNFDEAADADKVRTTVANHGISFPVLLGSPDIAAIYNIVYRYLFDRHRDLTLPTSFLIGANGDILKVYQGPANPDHVEYDLRHIPQTSDERLARALPFPGSLIRLSSHATISRSAQCSFKVATWIRQQPHFRLPFAMIQIARKPCMVWAVSTSISKRQTKRASASSVRSSFAPAIPTRWPTGWNNLGLLAGRAGDRTNAISYFLKLSS